MPALYGFTDRQGAVPTSHGKEEAPVVVGSNSRGQRKNPLIQDNARQARSQDPDLPDGVFSLKELLGPTFAELARRADGGVK